MKAVTTGLAMMLMQATWGRRRCSRIPSGPGWRSSTGGCGMKRSWQTGFHGGHQRLPRLMPEDMRNGRRL